MIPVISVDLRMVHASGIGTYIRNILPFIIETTPGVKFNLLGNIQEVEPYFAKYNNVTCIDCTTPIYSIAEQFEMAQKIPGETTLFWSPHYNIPLFYRGKLLVTVHDLFPLAMSHYVRGIHKQLYVGLFFGVLSRKAEAILTVSSFTTNELIRFTGCKKSKIFTVHNGVDAFWHKVPGEESPHGKPFILYVGNVKPHKNVGTLLQAFGLLAGQISHDLIIVGAKEGFITNDYQIEARAREFGDRVMFTGYVNDDLLRRYYSNAAVFVFPSYYEGFGLPSLEAMACGCPVAVSRVASLPETCGEAAIYFDPSNANEIASQILRLINDHELCDSLRQKALRHVKQFAWEKAGLQIIKILEGII